MALRVFQCALLLIASAARTQQFASHAGLVSAFRPIKLLACSTHVLFPTAYFAAATVLAPNAFPTLLFQMAHVFPLLAVSQTAKSASRTRLTVMSVQAISCLTFGQVSVNRFHLLLLAAMQSKKTLPTNIDACNAQALSFPAEMVFLVSRVA